MATLTVFILSLVTGGLIYMYAIANQLAELSFIIIYSLWLGATNSAHVLHVIRAGHSGVIGYLLLIINICNEK